MERDGVFTLLELLCVRLDLLAKKQTSKDGVFSFICRIFAYDRLHLVADRLTNYIFLQTCEQLYNVSPTHR